jgi:uncharacterized paraquat-inducible protein A
MILLKIQTFLKALWWHVWFGFPKSTKEQIEERLKICISCEEFDKKGSTCGICGCYVSDKKIFFNKLAWADQECPINKWSKLI